MTTSQTPLRVVAFASPEESTAIAESMSASLSREFSLALHAADTVEELRTQLDEADAAGVSSLAVIAVWSEHRSAEVTAGMQLARASRSQPVFLLLGTGECDDGQSIARLVRGGADGFVSAAHFEQLPAELRQALARHDAERRRSHAAPDSNPNQARYRAIAESTFDLIAELDAEARFVYASPNYALVLGHDALDLVGQSFFDLIAEDDRPGLVSAFTAALNGTRSALTAGSDHAQVSARFFNKSGERRCFESALRGLRTPEGQRHVVLVSRDISVQQRHDEEMSALVALSKGINAQTSLRDVATEVCTHLKELLPFDAVFLAIASELETMPPQDLIVVSSRDDAVRTPVLRRNTHAAHTVWGSIERDDVRLVNGYNPIDIDRTFWIGTRAFLDVPMWLEGRSWGVLHFASSRPFAWTPDHARLARMAGEQVAVAARGAQLLLEARQARETFRSLVDDINAVVWDAGPDWRFHYISPQIENWTGYAPERLIYDADLWKRMVHPDDRDRAREESKKHVAAGEDFQLDYRVTAADGHVIWLRNIVSVESHGEGEARHATRLRGVTIDITERKKAESDLRQSNAVLEATLEASADGICLLDEGGQIVQSNQRFREMWHISDELAETGRGLMGRVLSALESPTEFVDKINFLRANPESCSRDEICLKDGRVYERYSAPAHGAGEHRFGRVWTFCDVTERKRTEAQLAHQAFHDALTGLPNRTLFNDRVAHAITHLGRAYQSIAVLFLDLDRFKVINDSMGHDAGDKLLVEIARRLQTSMRPGDTAARFGGDEFTVLLEGLHDTADAVNVTNRILEALQAPFEIDERELYITSSIGIAITTDPNERPEDLLRNADVAMYRAKNKGKARYEVFDMAMSAAALEKLQLEIELRQAVKWQQLELDYQPLVDLESDDIVGVEALVRWHHPQRGLVSPADFIPIAEESGMIVPIGQWVLLEACKQARKIHRTVPGKPLRMSVNLSAKQFQQSDLLSDVRGALEETGLEAELLELEITESAIMEDADATIIQLEELKKLGVKLAIDDFGTGYSSLAYIERFPLDVLKIDRSFVAQIGKLNGGSANGLNGTNGHANGNGTNGNGANGHHEANGSNGHANGNGTNGNGKGKNGRKKSEASVVMQAVSTLGQGLGIRITAEGIETAEQLAHLRDLGCDIGQGFLFARPLSGPDLTNLLLQNRKYSAN